ncbi:alpha-amylase family glycosyl hydrolase [Peloplasma aerotolerans]|uniref:Alpha-amylase family glycosyl hydrolase n=1 Tax=Peloplasma aerotolerans TaxID=3044389 RepID=A0AAW6U5I0_9MOLU|nr:alpha-amylase family glycosyl hydrolase [Mariniplasma sp. M4Ah]MDI6453231.1 alpha-amylase family glycosyl hydrolase [Mariniplasma sp. M4Ah]
MARQTDLQIRSYTFYQVFPRQHSEKQNFEGVIDDLDRIKSLGADVLYLLPIHPIGVKARKGEHGSPYSITDYYAIHPDLGTLDDFKKLLDGAHQRGLKVMIDIVFNHTSRDSKLVNEKPHWFYKNAKGEFANRVGDWSDITDLDFAHREVWDYLIDVLVYWAKLVDGFRCDVAPLLPIDFWIEARSAVEKVNPNMIWLTESVHPGFIKYLRDMGYDCSSDSQMYEAFDMCYDYDIFEYMNEYLRDPSKLPRWIEEIARQEVTYPKNYIKLRSFENHDQPRLRSKVRDHNHFIQMNALMFFLRGAAFVYAGQEHSVTHEPTLFDVDLVPWNKSNSIEPFIQRMAALKKQPIFVYGNFNVHNSQDVVVLSYTYQHQFLLGIFNLEDQTTIEVPIIDGTYTNFVNEEELIVKNGKINIGESPIIIDTLKEHIK